MCGRANFSVTFSAVSTKNIGKILVEIERLSNIDYEISLNATLTIRS